MRTVIPLRPRRGRVVFVGAVHEARPALEALIASPCARVELVVTVPPTADGSAGRPSGVVDLTGLAGAAGIPVLPTLDVNAPDVTSRIREAEPDLMVVVGWTRLIGPSLLAVPSRGCVGFHASLLPAHRGRAPVNWAILRGEKVTGNTMLMLDAGVDTGDIVDQRAVAIGLEDTCATVYARIAQAGAEMLVRHLPALLAGTAPRAPQGTSDEEVLPRRVPAMGVTDWSRTAVELHDWVRALTLPYPGAFTSIGNRRVMVWRSRPPVEAGDHPPGTILTVADDAVRVSTGAGPLTLTVMGDPDGPPTTAGTWCRSAGLREGMRFDDVPSDLSRWALGLGPRPVMVRS